MTAIGVLVASALPASATHATDPSTRNMHALGESAHPATFSDPPAQRHINSDAAFWGDLAFDGNYDGFRIIDISAPGDPKDRKSVV